MAKGDKKKMQNQANIASSANQEGLDRVRNEAIIPMTNNSQNYYNQAAQQSFGDYNDIMNRYRKMSEDESFRNQPGLERVNYNRSPEMEEAFGGYREFANTGGYSPDQIRDMRARGISPIRSSYANALNEVERQKNLMGGYSPNASALRAKMASSQAQQMSDAAQNVNASLAEAINRGRQFGIGGMGDLSTTDTSFRQQAAIANQNAGLEIARNRLYDPRMGAIQGMAQLYGTAPGAAQAFGNQAQQGINSWLNAEQQQGQIGRDRMAAQQQVANTPSNFEVGMGRVGQGIGLAGQGAAAWMGVPGLPGANPRGMTGSNVYTPTNVMRGQYPQPPRR
jgi:hypothetical protein